MKAELPNWDWFLRIVERGSISAAARDLNQSPAALSIALKRLETQLGVRLFQRSTRQLSLTNEGDIWYRSARAAQAALDQGREALREVKGELAGPLRLSAPSDFGRQYVLDWVDEFVARHPAVEPALTLSDAIDNLVADSIDLAFRYGQPRDAAMVATVLVPDNRRIVVASPGYWSRRPPPRHPAELAEHDCLAFSIRDTPHTAWQFGDDDSRFRVQVQPRRHSNDGALVSEWARRGWGVAYKSRLDVASDLAAGQLVAALEDWQTEPTPLYLVRHGGRLLPARLRAFWDFCVDKMAGGPERA